MPSGFPRTGYAESLVSGKTKCRKLVSEKPVSRQLGEQQRRFCASDHFLSLASYAGHLGHLPVADHDVDSRLLPERLSRFRDLAYDRTLGLLAILPSGLPPPPRVPPQIGGQASELHLHSVLGSRASGFTDSPKLGLRRGRLLKCWRCQGVPMFIIVFPGDTVQVPDSGHMLACSLHSQLASSMYQFSSTDGSEIAGS